MKLLDDGTLIVPADFYDRKTKRVLICPDNTGDSYLFIKPKEGKWSFNNKCGTFKVWTCSECGLNMETMWTFCPHCGARMVTE